MTTTNKTYIQNWLENLSKRYGATFKLYRYGQMYYINEMDENGGFRTIAKGTLKELSKCIDMWLTLDDRFNMTLKDR